MLFKHKTCLFQRFKTHKRCLSKTTRIINRVELPAVAYQPKIVESSDKFKIWESNKIFEANIDNEKPVFSMVLPPPNVTGKLHLGHALTCTIQDVIVRRKRSLGYNVLWLPGIDHAGIATQTVVEKHLKSKHNINRNDMSRELFNKEVWSWKEKYGDSICEQLRMIGSSLDWSRQIFTMDPNHSHAVETAFIKLFEKGLIYRKKALVNWCSKLKSTISDIEVENVFIDKPTDVNVPGCDKPVKFGEIVDLAYKFVGSAQEIVVSTTMPETMLGDVAVAVHPNDERYKNLHGMELSHPFRNTKIPIIFDEFVDMKFGTGAVKITPAHSKVDYEVAVRHNLPLLEVIDENSCITNSDMFNGLNRYDCREQIIEKLKDMGLFRKVSPHSMFLPICSRTGDVIQHLPKEQWFVSCNELNKRAAEAVTNEQLRIEPDKFIKNWITWTNDDRDWCISRQLWWGHQIPAYKCTSQNNTTWVAATSEQSAIDKAAKYFQTTPNNILVERDLDVLDTWFSSGVYPFSSLGWPNSTKDFSKFYPLTLMITGHDILGFWVHRMAILGLELTEKLPFNDILLHAIICDNKGAKMSKSRGNVIDPIDIINGITLEDLNKKSMEMYNNGLLGKDEVKRAENYYKANFSRTNGIPECGIDALRFTLLSQDVKSHYIHFNVDLCHTNKLFCNKIWQSVKYIQLSLDKLKEINEDIHLEHLGYLDKWILSRLSLLVATTNKALDNYDFHVATKALKNLIYNDYCDIYLEATKPGFENEDPIKGYAHAHTLTAVLNTALRCLSPIMIYLTQAIIPKIPNFENNIVHNFNDLKNDSFDFPAIVDFEQWRNERFEKDVDNFLSAILLVRQVKGFYGIANNPRPKLCIKSEDKILQRDIIENSDVFMHLTRCGDITFDSNIDEKKMVSAVLNKNTIINVEVIGDDVNSLVRMAQDRLNKKIKKAEDAILKLEKKFASGNYLSSTPIWTQESNKEIVLNKKEELKNLQRLVML